jgi:hypothetical protein
MHRGTGTFPGLARICSSIHVRSRKPSTMASATMAKSPAQHIYVEDWSISRLGDMHQRGRSGRKGNLA